MTTIANHSERNIIRLQLKQNVVLKELRDSEMAALEPYLTIENHQKGDLLMNQGVQEMSQYFILDGILKRQVSNQEAKEMILRFSAERDIETSYAAWCLKMPTPFSIACVTKVRVARMPLPQWVDYMRSHSTVKQAFEYEVMNLMSAIMAHTITLHLLDAPGRVHRFMRKHPDLFERLPKKELAAYLNLSPETLSRLKNRGKI
ncbi:MULTISPECIES: Crp/Fnr family transcriptional regulator [Massilia]|uniref:Cyclic nucleotide-binding protein n=2 Tax=Massilia TaxID=149698 RepID=A0A422QEA0_9BURK|nr:MULTISPECIES: Crp/Fnr family transcriptional regulator [Massilia]MDY0965032.1 Crp/Fnr family transcriptional regulator [Massilia sp. CFBP9026]RNF28284.1 cyclic nucleotide-binding protein [Massilia aurea]TXG01276.1 Crp/Fnr family transcriptional regulator [Massilia arenae]